MNGVNSIYPSGEVQSAATHTFEGNRDIPIITSEPRFHESQLSAGEPQQLPYASGYQHAIQYLRSVEKLFIQQNIALLEVIVGINASNKYLVLNPMGQRVFLALEESNCCAQIFCAPKRNFEMSLFDNSNNEVIRMRKHMNCQDCPLCLDKLDVYAPSGDLVGFVKAEFPWLNPKFGVFDKDGMKVLQIDGPVCALKCCNEINYQIKMLTGEVVGTICRQWMGFLQEGFTDADNFRLEFPLELDANVKIVLLGAAFLIDYIYYEKH